ncbi:DUF998 domain-containing protein [Plantactinospora sp. B5E13]|uniref:DUF998 domain-containing protein n=1 Tax=unclassified Plantactinospora TaxID=2631981 RepID=UPI00325C36B4
MTRTRVLLGCGVVGALLFIAVLLVNGVVKPGYDPARDFVSEGAIGRGGWLQIAGFVASGTLLTAFSFGLRRTTPRWTAWLVRTMALCLVGAGIFVSDPVPADAATVPGIVHNVVSVVVFAALAAATFTAIRWRPTRLWRWYCLLSGIGIIVFFVAAGGADPVAGTPGIFQRLSIVTGWTWLAVLGLRAPRTEATTGRTARTSTQPVT